MKELQAVHIHWWEWGILFCSVTDQVVSKGIFFFVGAEFWQLLALSMTLWWLVTAKASSATTFSQSVSWCCSGLLLDTLQTRLEICGCHFVKIPEQHPNMEHLNIYNLFQACFPRLCFNRGAKWFQVDSANLNTTMSSQCYVFLNIGDNNHNEINTWYKIFSKQYFGKAIYFGALQNCLLAWFLYRCHLHSCNSILTSFWQLTGF